jgi:hypothetical protein
LETRSGDPKEPDRVHAKLPPGVVADNHPGGIFSDTAVKVFSFGRLFEVALRVVRGHETGRDVAAENPPPPDEWRGSHLVGPRVVSLTGFLANAEKSHGN